MPRASTAGLLAGGLWIVLAAPGLACEIPPAMPGFVVSPAGDDAQDGTPDRPFRTIERARLAMRNAGPRATYIDGGVYALTATLRLDSSDNGSSFLNCPGQAPALDGGAAGLSSLVEIAGATGIALRGLTFAHASGPALAIRDSERVLVERGLFAENGTGIRLVAGSLNTVCANRIFRSAASGVEIQDGSDRAIVADNVIAGTDAPATHGGGIFVHGATATAIVRNRVQDTRGVGIGVANWDAGTINRGTVVSGNVVRAANRASEDSGAIYLLGRSHVDQQSLISGNLVEDAGAPGDAHAIGIYLDDSTSGVVVERNVIRRPGTHAIQIHGGDDILIRRNFIDLGDQATSAVLFQAAPDDTHPTNTMQDNQVSQNVIIARGTAQAGYTFLNGGAPTIVGNLLVRPAAWTVPQDSAVSDVAIALPASGSHGDEAAIVAVANALIDFVPIDAATMGPDPAIDCATVRSVAAVSPATK